MTNKIKYVFLFSYLLCFNFIIKAQEDAKTTLPSSPAFSILDFEPSAVMRPTNTKDLAADVLNSFDKKGNLMMNLGMEVSPYWLKSNHLLTRENYLNPTLGQCFIQSLNISAATVKDSAKGESKLGLGFRFKLVNGKPLEDLTVKENELKAEQSIIAAIATTKALIGVTITTKAQAISFISTTLKGLNYSTKIINQFVVDAQKQAALFSDDNAGISSFIESLIDIRTNADGTLIKQVAELSKKRIGFILEIAGASSFITNVNAEPVEKIGLWINASNYTSQSSSWTATGRYLFTGKDSAISNADLGISYLKEMSSFNISVEALARWYRMDIPDFNLNNQPITRVEQGFTYRVAVSGSYKIANNISLNLSFGKNFDSPLAVNYSFFSIFGINYSLYKPEKINLAN